MKKNLPLSILLFIFSVTLLRGQELKLVPATVKYTAGTGKFSLRGARIVLTPELLERENCNIESFVARIRELTGTQISTSFNLEQAAPAIFLKSEQPGPMLRVPDEKTGPASSEAYSISIKPGRIDVNAKTDAGIFCAIQTLKQMIMADAEGGSIPAAQIEDFPALAYRGVMMDMSHGGLLTEEEIKRQIDFLASWKMNQYYFYNEVSIEMKGYPLINYNACYTQDQIKRIVAYGRERHMDVIPFVEFYGHLHELLRLEKYASLGIGKYGHDLDPRNPGVEKILADWIRQYAEMFPSPFIHIGFDETWETERLKIADKSIHPKELYLRQLNYVADVVRSYGKKVMVWTDISNNYPDIIAEFPKDIIPVLWEYSDTPASMDKWLGPVRKEKLPFFVQSAVDSWGNVYPASKYTYDNIDICLRTCTEQKAIGYITSVWTDAIQPLLRNTWLFMAYGCAGSWEGKTLDRKAFEESFCRIMYPGTAPQMTEAFAGMAESQDWLAKALDRHTLTQMWDDPFSPFHLKNTAAHLQDYKNARLAAENAQEKLCEALNTGSPDSSFIKSMLVHCRQLDYTASRFIWARTIVDRWNWIYDLQSKGEKDYVMFYDINYSTHGLLADMMDISTSVGEEYRKAWLAENMEYRLGSIMGRFDTDYLMWRKLYLKISDYISHDDTKAKRKKFEQLFLQER
jgi:hexosaminidase